MLIRVFVLCLALTPAACGGSDSPTSPTPGTSSNLVHYTVLGASDGIGYGSSVPCAPFDTGCENGTGYAQTIRRRFQNDGRTVTFDNWSFPGYVLTTGMADLAVSLGRSDPGSFERFLPFVRASTSHLTLFAGGNDANVIGSAVAAGRGGGDVRGYVDDQVRQWGADLVDYVNRVRSRAPNARLVAYNLPNLGAAPYMAGRSLQDRSIMQRIATGIADQVNGLASRNVIVVDLMCDARVLQPSSFSSDGFHPSDAGYALMAELGYAALSTGSAPAPQAVCGARTVLPVF